MKVILKNGLPAITDNYNNIILSDISCEIEYNSAPGEPLLKRSAKGEWKLFETKNGWTAKNDNAVIEFSEKERGICFKTQYTSDIDIKRADTFIMMSCYMPDTPATLTAPGLSYMSGNRTNEMLAGVGTFNLSEGDKFNCGDYGTVRTKSGKYYIAGYITYNEFFGSVKFHGNGKIDISEFMEFHPVKKGETVTSDVFYITECSDPIIGLPEYCDLMIKTNMENRPPRMHHDIPVGFCTWYYYMPRVSSKIIDHTLNDALKSIDDLPIKYIQIDDGWFDHRGDWNPNKKFPEGMKAEADKIKAAGFVPGIWIAPLLVDGDSELFKNHPEYCVRDWGQSEARVGDYGLYNLDPSIKEVQDILRELFRKATYDWGYKYIKVDIITSSVGPFEYRDPSYNALKAYKKVMEIINESVPRDTFILGCTAPFGSSIGYVDGMRVSGDVQAGWDSIRFMFNDIFKRWFYGNKMFINDADCLIIRKSENEDEECERNCTRNDDEIRTYISAAAASGGTIMFSDKFSLLHDWQLKQLSYLFPLNTEPAVPLDIMDSPIPTKVDNGTHEGIRTLMLFNWDDDPRTVEVDVGNCHVFEFWSRKYKGVKNGSYSTEIPPHCAEIIFATEASHPKVVGTDSACTPKIKQKYENGLLTFQFEKKNETVYIAASRASSDEIALIKNEDGLFTATQSGDKMEYTISAE